MRQTRCHSVARRSIAVAIVAASLARSSTDTSAALPIAPDPWLAVDRNRTGIVADLVGHWDEVTKSGSAGRSGSCTPT